MARKAIAVVATALVAGAGILVPSPALAASSSGPVQVCGNAVAVSETVPSQNSAVAVFSYNGVYLLNGETNQILVAGLNTLSYTYVVQQPTTNSIYIGSTNYSVNPAAINAWIVEQWVC
jgi:hypothetical protein